MVAVTGVFDKLVAGNVEIELLPVAGRLIEVLSFDQAKVALALEPV